jgi:predicted ester cyclase
MRTAFPDFKADLAALVADEESIAFAYTLSETHKGPIVGHARAGKEDIDLRGAILEIRDGKMVERDGAVQINSGCFSSLE